MFCNLNNLSKLLFTIQTGNPTCSLPMESGVLCLLHSGGSGGTILCLLHSGGSGGIGISPVCKVLKVDDGILHHRFMG